VHRAVRGGAGGSLRAGVTENPVLLTRSIKEAWLNVTCGGAPAYVWPGGGITVMVDVMRMPDRSFGTVPTPAIVAPIEFTMRWPTTARWAATWATCGRWQVLATGAWHDDGAPQAGAPPWRGAGQPLAAGHAAAPARLRPMAGSALRLPGGRWHFQHGPIDIVIGADGDAAAVRPRTRPPGSASSRC
jgi:hypothetical protein